MTSRVSEAAALMRAASDDDWSVTLPADVVEAIADAIEAIDNARTWQSWPAVEAALNRLADVYLGTP